MKNPSFQIRILEIVSRCDVYLFFQREGFFVECGAYDGETRSNTLNLERELGWSGVLIEADPVNLIKCL